MGGRRKNRPRFAAPVISLRWARKRRSAGELRARGERRSGERASGRYFARGERGSALPAGGCEPTFASGFTRRTHRGVRLGGGLEGLWVGEQGQELQSPLAGRALENIEAEAPLEQLRTRPIATPARLGGRGGIVGRCLRRLGYEARPELAGGGEDARVPNRVESGRRERVGERSEGSPLGPDRATRRAGGRAPPSWRRSPPEGPRGFARGFEPPRFRAACASLPPRVVRTPPRAPILYPTRSSS
jgi:hypothetical protein